jgi:glycerol-3-phosphate dehydrogenase (NAD(P)+)
VSLKRKVSIIGGGSWGSAIACMFARCIGKSLLYTIEEEVAFEINNSHQNSRFLDEVKLPNGLEATTDMSAVIDSSIIIIAVPSFAFSATLQDLKKLGLSKDTNILIATKGMCDDPVQLFSEKIESMFENFYGFISGPNFAKEVAEGKFAAITISSKNITFAKEIASILCDDELDVTVTDDIITVQIAALIKNIVAIRSGMMEAEGHGENARAWLISMGLSEIGKVASLLGGKQESLSLPAVVGDMVLTSYSKTSRNTRFGYEFHKNSYSKKYLDDYPFLVEGVSSARLLKKYLNNYDIKLPIINSVADRV